MTTLPGSASLPPASPTRCSATIARFSRAMTTPWCAWSAAPLCLCAALADMRRSRCRCRHSMPSHPACSPAARSKRQQSHSRARMRTARRSVLFHSILAMSKTARPSMPGMRHARAWKTFLTWCLPPWPATYTPATCRVSGPASRRGSAICRLSKSSTIMRTSRA